MDKKIDINKEFRDSMDETLETKFLMNLQWSMLFFCFNYISKFINEENNFEKNHVQNEFIKTWKNFAHSQIASTDLEKINEILNSPKNIFYSILQNDDEETESTEIYQEKYNNILMQIEKFYLNTLNNQKKFDSSNDEDDNQYE